MSLNRLLITAAVIENRPVDEVAATYGVSRLRVYRLLARYRREGEAAFEQGSRRPALNPNAIPPEGVELELGEKLTATGLDAGPDTIRWHLEDHHATTVSRATIDRHLAKAGLVVPEPKKRPKASYVRFAAEQPSECWQSDFTHYRLTPPDGRPGADSEVLSWLDGHSRDALSVTAYRCHRPDRAQDLPGNRCRARDSHLHADGQRHGLHHPTLRRTPWCRHPHGFETELRRLWVVQKNGKPNHPQTQGKVERFSRP